MLHTTQPCRPAASINGAHLGRKSTGRIDKRKRTHEISETELQDGDLVLTPCIASVHPFEADPRDHAETPFEAYRDIAPLLHALAQRLHASDASKMNPITAAAQLRIYDPYYCEGSVVKYMARLGFTNVYNHNEDFYAVVAAGKVPDFDVLVTNPPFSGDHMERIVRWAERCGRPWFLLMPHFVANKPYYHDFRHRSADAGHPLPFYLGPTSRAYVFAAPLHTADGVTPLVDQRPSTAVVPIRAMAEEMASKEDKIQTLPAGCFQCVWFIQLGEAHVEPVLARWREECEGRPGVEATVAREAKLLPQLTLVKRPTPAERRWRKKQRRLAAEGEGHAVTCSTPTLQVVASRQTEQRRAPTNRREVATEGEEEDSQGKGQEAGRRQPAREGSDEGRQRRGRSRRRRPKRGGKKGPNSKIRCNR